MEENPEDENSPIECAEIDVRDKRCDTISENKEELSNHIKQTHGIKCDSCYVQIEKEGDMKEHMRLFHHSRCLNCDRYPVDHLHGKFREMYCQICSSDIKEKYSKGQLKMGKQCVDCKIILANEKDFKDHEKIEHGTCRVCMMNFEGRKELETHKGIAHHFKCQECGKVYPTFKDLIEHQTLIDSGRQCGLCHKKFHGHRMLK